MKTLRITLEGRTYEVGVELIDAGSGSVKPVVQVASVVAVPASGPLASAAPAPMAAAPASTGGGHSLVSPMPGVVFKVRVAVGEQVAKDQELIVLEAMKMETPIYAPSAGTVTAILVKEADSVNEGQVLVQLS